MRAPWPAPRMVAAVLLVVAIGCTASPPVTTRVGTTASPWRTEDPPLVAGIRLGDSLAQVRAVLGAPEGERRLVGGARELEYWRRGMMVVTTEDQGVAMLGLLHPGAPVVHGVRVGDPVPWMEQQWGAMDRRAGTRGSYLAGRWGIMISIDTTTVPARVQSITFGWAAPNRSAQLPGVDAPDLPR